jgi:hypothetical protein
MKPSSISFVEWNSRITSGTPGANIELASGVRNVIAEINMIMPHFFQCVQFNGFSKSFGPSKSTMFGSTTGSSTSSMLDDDSASAPFSMSFSSVADMSFLSLLADRGRVDAWLADGGIDPRLVGMSASCPSAAARSMMSLLVATEGAVIMTPESWATCETVTTTSKREGL